VKTARYDFTYVNQNDETIITLPNINKEIIVGGKKISEKLDMVVWIPNTKKIRTELILQ
jgi:hypothetical protein